MLIIPDEVKALFQTDGVHKNFHVHFPNGDNADLNNEDVVQESVKFTESLCSQTYFKFGLAEASQLEFTAVGIPNILGSTIECAIEIDCTSLGAAWATAHPVDPSLAFLVPQTCNVNTKLYYRVPYGSFVVDSCPRDHSIMAQRKIVAYSPDIELKAQVIPGQYPSRTISLRAPDWIAAQGMADEDMNHLQFTTPTPGQFSGYIWETSNMYKSNGVDRLTDIGGTARAKGTNGNRILQVSGSNLGTYVIRPYFQSNEFDNYGREFCDAAISSIPSGSYYYDITGVKVYNSNAEAAAWSFGCFQPCLMVSIGYRNSEYTASFVSKCKPIFVNSGETYILDLATFNNLVPYNSPPSGTDIVSQVSVYLSVPMVWDKAAVWHIYDSSDVSITGWANAAPFGTRTRVMRSGAVDIYYAKLNTDSSFPAAVINNTLTINKGNGLGNYYTYSNAISGLKFLIGMVELLGEFWKINRDGSATAFDISTIQTSVSVPRSAWEEFWWDENTVEAIGTVGVKFIDETSGEESITQFIIGSGASVYVMEDNEILSHTTATANDILTFLNTYFAPNAAVVNFTPVELKMKGLPYLEDGDKIELTADDNTVVETYILEHTISGIQHLIADVTSTNGELLEVIEE